MTENSRDDLIRRVRECTDSDAFRVYLRDLLVELCRIDTTPGPDIERMRRAEAVAFDVIERELGGAGLPGARLERRPIDPAIAAHPNYSKLHFTKTPENPEGLPPEIVYAGRGNLLCIVPGTDANGCGVALNAHVDVVHPYFPPRFENGVVYGRGAADDKGPVVAMVAALKVLSGVLAATGRRLRQNVVAMFVVEEETGGNGSLSLALDRELKRLYDTILVMECTENVVHPANRGAVWYQAKLRCPGVSLFEMFAFVNEALEEEGRALKAESRHALFPQRPVQTCHGIIGPFGEHPSRICGHVVFQIAFDRVPPPAAEALIRDCIDAALAVYVGVYGDKTAVIDPLTGKPKVARHVDVHAVENGFRIEVHGSTGHMGAILENDGAITKMAGIVRALCRSKAKLAALAGTEPCFRLEGWADNGELNLEGGQGFVPTHDITEVMARMARAAERGADRYLRQIGHDARGCAAVAVTYDKLHNPAFDGDPDSLPMRHAVAAAQTCGTWKGTPVVGWTVSCDARLFASEYPDMPVLTAGAGRLTHAHSDLEQLAIEDLRRNTEFVAVYLLHQAEVV